jgi:hypothetical protein
METVAVPRPVVSALRQASVTGTATELMKQLRERHPLAHTVTPPVGFSELLDGVRECLPAEFPQADLLTSYTRTALGDFYGGQAG